MKPILILQNDRHEGAGTLANLIDARGLEQRSILGSGADYAKLPSDAFSALVVLGGAQSAYETDRYPYLSGQMQLCRDFIGEGKPVAGFCLGAQLLACAVGGEVVPGKSKEIGWYDLMLTEAGANDPLMEGHPRKLLSYHFHGDVIAKVPGAERLAYSDMTECQLFRYGNVCLWLPVSRRSRSPLARDHVPQQSRLHGVERLRRRDDHRRKCDAVARVRAPLPDLARALAGSDLADAAASNLSRADDRRYPAYDALGSRYAVARRLRDLAAKGRGFYRQIGVREGRCRSDVASLSLRLDRLTRSGFQGRRNIEDSGERTDRNAGNDKKSCFAVHRSPL